MSSLSKYEPFRELESLARRMNDLFDWGKNGTGTLLPQSWANGFTPKIDVSEDDKNIYIHADLPGMESNDVKVTMSEDGVLTIRGEKKKEVKEEDKSKNYLRIERNYGSFTRSFTLPENVKTDAVDGTFEKGVLTLTLPKVELEKSKETEIPLKTK